MLTKRLIVPPGETLVADPKPSISPLRAGFVSRHFDVPVSWFSPSDFVKADLTKAVLPCTQYQVHFAERPGKHCGRGNCNPKPQKVTTTN